jgi:hypothetical protein
VVGLFAADSHLVMTVLDGKLMSPSIFYYSSGQKKYRFHGVPKYMILVVPEPDDFLEHHLLPKFSSYSLPTEKSVIGTLFIGYGATPAHSRLLWSWEIHYCKER